MTSAAEYRLAHTKPRAPTSPKRRIARIPSEYPSPPPVDHAASLCVLASGSKGNAAVLTLKHEGQRHAVLLDCGLSPRHTFAALKAADLAPAQLSAVVLTHLDSDHFKSAWVRSMPRHTPVYLHRQHRGRAQRQNFFTPSTLLFDEPFELAGGRLGVHVEPLLLAHDELGVAAFRLHLPNGSSLGYATDLGHTTPQLAEHLRGVDVLAIESNYCPLMQEASPRPAFLKERITSGSGHLSNQQTADIVQQINPREHVVLLHLSRECNTPELARAGHANRSYCLSVSDQFIPTDWIHVQSPSVHPPSAP